MKVEFEKGDYIIALNKEKDLPRLLVDKTLDADLELVGHDQKMKKINKKVTLEYIDSILVGISLSYSPKNVEFDKISKVNITFPKSLYWAFLDDNFIGFEKKYNLNNKILFKLEKVN